MRIFKCSMDNLDDVSMFYDKVTEYLEKNVNYPKWMHGEYPGRESAARAITDGGQYVCVDDDRVVGAFILNDNPQGDYSTGEWQKNLNRGEYLVIHTLATDPEIYHNGLGSLMVEFCADIARKNGYKALRLDVVPTNAPARGLYEKLGFRYAGEKDLSRNIEEIPVFALYELNF